MKHAITLLATFSCVLTTDYAIALDPHVEAVIRAASPLSRGDAVRVAVP